MDDGKNWIPLAINPWDEIFPDLWQGGMYFGPQMTPCAPEDQFDVVVSMAGRGGLGTRVTSEAVVQHNFYIDDDRLGPAEMAIVMEALGVVKQAWDDKHKVLVRCAAGYNRSGLIVGLRLVQLFHTADEAITLIRAQRSPHALCNPHFIKYIHDYAGN